MVVLCHEGDGELSTEAAGAICCFCASEMVPKISQIEARESGLARVDGDVVDHPARMFHV
jgi:hypothetical protein